MSEHLKEEVIIPYLDGRLSAAERAQVEAHLAGCAACRAQVDELRALLGVLAEWAAAEPSPAFDARLRTRLAEESAPALPWLSLRPAYGVLLAVAVLIAVATSLWEPASRQPVPPAPTPQVARETPAQPEAPPAPQVQRPQPTPANGDELAVLDNPVLLENYDLLTEFDILFELLHEEKGKTL